jgi:DNA-binding PucR family transcriptional regulator
VIAARRPQPVTLYEDVALEALGLQDAYAAREFVSDALAGLDGDDKRSRQLRETLEVYFRSEQNAAATAAALRVHDATVGRRLAEVERLTGRRVNQRRAELETALRLRSLL